MNIAKPAITVLILISAACCAAELSNRLAPALDHPAIQYFNYIDHPARDPVAQLKQKVESGELRLSFTGEKGYLPAVLQALNLPIESQIAVFSKTSLQEARIEPSNPRTLFFNDSTLVAWVRGGFIELIGIDPQQGPIFYSLEQQAAATPNIVRRDDCLSCHISDATLGVPGLFARSFYTLPDGSPKLILGGNTTDHRSPFEERWGGWYATGSMGHARHMGNATLGDPDHPESMITPDTLHVASLEHKFDTHAYLSPFSDVVALLVFGHQIYMTDLITRVGWDVRCAVHDKLPPAAMAALLRDSAKEFVDYLLFIEEAPLPGAVQGTSGFAEKFAAQGPRDGRGRSLRDFDLHTRLFRYPCSYMIYSRAFDALPVQAKSAIYARLWQILSGEEKGSRYSRLSLADRQAIVGILRDTQPDVPNYFRGTVQ